MLTCGCNNLYLHTLLKQMLRLTNTTLKETFDSVETVYKVTGSPVVTVSFPSDLEFCLWNEQYSPHFAKHL